MKKIEEKVLIGIIVIVCLFSIFFTLTYVQKQEASLTEVWLVNQTKMIRTGNLVNFVIGTKSNASIERTFELFLDNIRMGEMNVTLSGLRYFDVSFEKAFPGRHLVKVLIYDNTQGYGSKEKPYQLHFYVDVI